MIKFHQQLSKLVKKLKFFNCSQVPKIESKLVQKIKFCQIYGNLAEKVELGHYFR